FGSTHLLPQVPQLTGSFCRSKPSSIWPSQLSSRLLHTSSFGPCPIWQTFCPPAQMVAPWVHTPQHLPEHTESRNLQLLLATQELSAGQKSSQEVPTSFGLLSMLPSQSSSAPLQVSALGGSCAQWYSQPSFGLFGGRSL